MTPKEELELILKLIGKYNLPLSPILEYAIKEKMEEYPEKVSDISIMENKDDALSVSDSFNNNTIVENAAEDYPSSIKDIQIVDYGSRTIAVIGDTKTHKDDLKALGGFFVLRTQWGPAWIFRSKKRESIQAYIDGEISVDYLLDDSTKKETKKESDSRYIIRVKYPNGSSFSSKLVWETLVDVVKYAGPEEVRKLGIRCMGDNLISDKLNNDFRYRSAQKEIGRGLYVCTYSSTDVKYNQIQRINGELNLGLSVEKVYLDGNGDEQIISNTETFNRDKLKGSTRDRTKFSFEGSEMFSKRRFVLEVVRYFVHCHPQISYESLIRVFPPTLNSNKSNGVIRRYDDIQKQIAWNPEVRNRFFLKGDEIIELFNGMKVVVHNQWGDDFKNFLKIAETLYNVKSNNVSNAQDVQENSYTVQNNNIQTAEDDKRIGYTVRIFPSQEKGVIERVRIDKRGNKKLIIRTKTYDLVEIDDLPYLYEILKRN